MVARGEVWWFEPPDEKPRPYLILTRDEAIPVLTRVIGVPVTRSERRIPSEVELGRSDGMPAEGVLSLDNLGALDKAFLTRRITVLPVHRWPEVCAALNLSLDC